jgi:hypothetical protein
VVLVSKVNKHQILGQNDIDRKEISIPQWKTDKPVFVRQLKASESRKVFALLDDKVDPLAIAKIVTVIAVDEDGANIFEESDAKVLSEKNANALNHIVNEWISFISVEKKD